jgi:hypothetical protein
LQGNDCPSAETHDGHALETKGRQQGGGVIRVLGGPAPRPVLAAAAARPAPVIGDNSQFIGETLCNRPIELGILICSSDQQNRRTRSPNLCIQPRTGDFVVGNPSRRSVPQGIRIDVRRFSHG